MSSEAEIETLSDLVDIMKADIGKLLGANITVAIVDSEAEIKFIDTMISKFSDFIISFTKGNFSLLSIGDHSLPLSGTNIAFFKVSERALVILNSDKGPVGQLLAFKGRMSRYAPYIDDLMDIVAEEEEEKVPAKAAVRVPVLIQSIANKKFGMEEAKVLHLVNGENTITDICEKTKLPQLKVDEILRKYQKKGWIKLKRVIVGLPKEELEKPAEKEEKVSIAESETISPAPSKPLISRQESVYLFPILEEPFDPKKYPKPEAKILQLCDGQYTINDIVDQTNLNQLQVMEIIKKYEKKGKLTITKILPPAAAPEVPTPPPPQPPAQIEQPSIPAPTIYESPPPPAAYSPPPTSPLPVVPEPESEDIIFDDLMQLMETTQPIEQTAPPPPQRFTAPPIPQSASPVAPPKPTSPPIPAPSTTPPMPVQPQAPIRATPPPAPSPAKPTTTPSRELEGEPVSESVFDDLKNLLDEVAPMSSPGSAAPATPSAPLPPQPPAPEITMTPPSPPSPVTSEGLLEETDEGIIITTYPEEDPLQARLARLSNILDETTDKVTPKEEIEEVKIIGSKAVCPECKTHVTMMAKICPNCERPLRICPNCNSPITLFARICPSCGSLL